MSNNPQHILLRGSRIPFNVINLSNKGVLQPFGEHLRQYKEKKGLSYKDMSELTGYSGTMIFKLIKGQVDYCGISTLSRIALSCGSTLAEWVKPIEAPNSPTAQQQTYNCMGSE